jgi:drug/metabolite transporter (DMT)-like permease
MLKKTIFYVLVVCIWGSTWLGIKFQLGRIDPMVSVVYRFALAAAILLVYCRLAGLNMRFRLVDHVFMALQGACLFALNYWLFYVAELTLTSGIVAVTFSTIVFFNILNGHLFLGSPVRPKVVLGALTGITGIGLVFWPELSGFTLTDVGFMGLVLSVGATLLASFGNILSARNQRSGLPVVQTNAYGMAYGAVLMAAGVLATGRQFAFETDMAYVISLIYLAVFGSIVAFGCYLTLIGKMGADRAAYANLIFPVIALALSTVFEGYRWPPAAIVGVVLILVGNAIALTQPEHLDALKKRFPGRFGPPSPPSPHRTDSRR